MTLPTLVDENYILFESVGALDSRKAILVGVGSSIVKYVFAFYFTANENKRPISLFYTPIP